MVDIVGYFPPTLAIDSATGTRLKNAAAQVYKMTDTAFASPLQITDITDVPFTNNTISSNSDGIYPDFKTEAGVAQVIVKSGQALTPMTSIAAYADAAVVAVGHAQAAAEDAETASEVADQAARDAKLAADAARAVGAMADAQIAAIMANPSPTLLIALVARIVQTAGYNSNVRYIEEFLEDGEQLDPTRTTSMSTIFQRAFDRLGAEYQALLPFANSPHGFIIVVPAGHFRFDEVLLARAGVGVRGQGMSQTFFYHSHTDAWLNGTVPLGTPLSDQKVLFPDLTFEDFTLDGALQPDPAAYDSRMKGIFIQSLERLQVLRVQIRNTLATAFGFDYVKSGVFDSCVAMNAGRGHILFGDEHIGSGSCFGLGSGLYDVEAVTFRSCLALGAYVNGYFIETVRSRPGVNKLSRGIKFIDCRAYDNWYGFVDAGGRGASVSGCDFSRNHAYGYAIDSTHAAPFGGVDGSVTDTIIEQNGPTGSETHSGGGVLIAMATQGGYTFGADVHIRDNNGPGYRFTNEGGWNPDGRFTLAGLVYRNLGAAVRAARSLPPKLTIERMKTWLNTAALEIVGAFTAVEPRIRFNDFGEDSTITQTMSAPVVDLNVGLGLRSPSLPVFTFNPAVPGQGVLNWRAPLETVDDYKIEWLNVASGVWTPITGRVASTATTQAITGLPNFAQVQFRASSIIGGVVVGTPAVTPVTRLIPTPVAADYFNGADRALNGKTLPDGSSNAYTWVDEGAADFKQLSGSIRPDTYYSGRKALCVNMGSPYGTMRFQLSSIGTGAADLGGTGYVFWYVDSLNFMVVDILSNGGWRLRRCVNGNYTVLATITSTYSLGDVVMIQVSPSNVITVTVNDNAPVTWTESVFAPANKRGVIQAGVTSGTRSKHDNAEFWLVS